jgi:hypothetical protein
MGKLTDLLKLAQDRASELALPYAGALTPQEAYTRSGNWHRVPN